LHDGCCRLPGPPLRIKAVKTQPSCIPPTHLLRLPEHQCREPTLRQRLNIRPGDEGQFAGLEERHSLIRNSERASSPKPVRPHQPSEDHCDGGSPTPSSCKGQWNRNTKERNHKSKKQTGDRSVQGADHDVGLVGAHRRSISRRWMGICTEQLSPSPPAVSPVAGYARTCRSGDPASPWSRVSGDGILRAGNHRGFGYRVNPGGAPWDRGCSLARGWSFNPVSRPGM
jgi:hypothetical protein